MSLEIGKTYAYDDWMFVVLKKVGMSTFAVLILDSPHDTRYKTGMEMEMWEGSVIAESAREVK